MAIFAQILYQYNIQVIHSIFVFIPKAYCWSNIPDVAIFLVDSPQSRHTYFRGCLDHNSIKREDLGDKQNTSIYSCAIARADGRRIPPNETLSRPNKNVHTILENTFFKVRTRF